MNEKKAILQKKYEDAYQAVYAADDKRNDAYGTKKYKAEYKKYLKLCTKLKQISEELDNA